MDRSGDPGSLDQPAVDSVPEPLPIPPPFSWETGVASTAPTTPRPPTRFTRALEAVAWVVGIAGLLFLGRIYGILSGPSEPTPEELGTAFGRIIAAVIIGVVIRWIFVRVRHVGTVRSPWILVVAMALLLVGVARPPAPAQSAGPVLPVDTYLEIEAPFSLAAPTAGEKDEFKTAIAGNLGAYEVRRVIEDGELVGFLIVADIDVASSPDWASLERGFESNPGAAARQDVVGGRTAVVGTAADAATVMWVESPYLLAVYGIDEDSARLMAVAVMTSYERRVAARPADVRRQGPSNAGVML